MIKRNTIFRTLFFLIIAGLFVSSSLSAQDTIRVGVLAYRGEAKSLQAWQETADYLNEKLPSHIFTISPLSFREMDLAVSQKKIDLLICNPANAILFGAKYDVKPIATLQKQYKNKAYAFYGSVFFTLKTKTNINRLKDLKGKKIAAVDRLSLGGYLLPQEVLSSQGLDLEGDAKTLIFNHNHDEVVFSVLHGLADIGVVRTGILEEMAENGNLNLEDIKILSPQSYPKFPFLVSTDLIPEWPLVQLPHFPNDISLNIVRELYKRSEQDKDHNTSVSNYSWALPADYSVVSEKLKRIQAPTFENKEPNLLDIPLKNWNFFFLLLSLTTVLAFFLVFSRYILRQLDSTKKEDHSSLMDHFKDGNNPFFNSLKTFGFKCAQQKYKLNTYLSFTYLKYFLFVALGYFLSVKFGLLFALINGNTAIWFASGIGFIAVYTLGYRIWPALFIGALIATISSLEIESIIDISSSQVIIGLINASNNVVEAILGVYIIRRLFGTRPLFSTIQSTASFIILVAFFTSLLSAVIGTLSSTNLEPQSLFYEKIITWWLGDAAGLLLVVPLFLSWKKPTFSSSVFKQTVLIIIFCALLVLVGAFIFQLGYHLAYVFLPFFIYFTFKFGRFYSLLMAFILELVSVWVLIYLHIYWNWETPVEGMFYVRLFVLILLLTILVVAAMIDEQNLAEDRMSLYRKIVQNSSNGIAIIDPEGRYIEQNPAHEKLIGYTDKELEGRTPEIHLGSEVFKTIATELSETSKSVGEWVSHTKHGDKLIDLSSFSVFNAEQELLCYVGIKRDITERKNAEMLLKKSEAEAWSLYEDAAIPIMIEDFSAIKIYLDKLKSAGLKDWEAYFDQNPEEIKKLVDLIEVISVNKKMIDFYGEGNKKNLLENPSNFFLEESYSVFRREIIAFAKGNYSFSSEIPIRGFQGKVLHLLISLSVPELYKENMERVIVSFVDITGIKQAENVQKTLLNISNATNAAKDLNEVIQTVSVELASVIDPTNFFLALYNADKDELTLPFAQGENKFPERIPASKTLTSLVINKKTALLFTQEEMEEMEKKGELNPAIKIPKVWLGTPLKVKGKVIGAFAVQSYTDANAYSENDKKTLEIVSNQIALSIERKQAEDKILDALEKVQESDRIKSAFLSSMSHELRTPLNAIIGFSNLIDDEMSLDQAVQFAGLIHKSGRNLLQIVDSIFEVSLLDEGVQKLSIKKHSFEVLMNDVYQTILTRKKVLNKSEISIKLKHNWASEQEIFTDGPKLKHIFLHLLNNALKFTSKGTIHFGLEKITDDGSSYFYVSDTGIGIPEKDISFIFDRFRMGDDKHNRQHDGMGVGLFICKKLVELLGGEIKVVSEKNKGSYFSFYLPLQKNKQMFLDHDPN